MAGMARAMGATLTGA